MGAVPFRKHMDIPIRSRRLCIEVLNFKNLCANLQQNDEKNKAKHIKSKKITQSKKQYRSVMKIAFVKCDVQFFNRNVLFNQTRML